MNFSAVSRPDLVLLQGWGMASSVWSEVSTQLEDRFRLHCVDLSDYDELAPYTLDALVEHLSAKLPPQTQVCGWSLGGLIALQWALRCPGQVQRLVLIASTPRFLCDRDWQCGLEWSWFERFKAELERDPRRTLKRFASLQAQGDNDAARVRCRLSACLAQPTVADVRVLQAGLAILQAADLRASLPRIAQPVLILHGAADAIVPLAAGEYLQQSLPQAKLEVFAKTAHAPLIADAQRTARHLREFLQ